MATIPDSWALLKSFFHALGKSNIAVNTHPNAAKYKSLGIVTSYDLLIDKLPWVDWVDERNGINKLTDWAIANPTKLKKYDKAILSPVPTSGSDLVGWQAYYFDLNLGGTFAYGQTVDTWLRPWISPVDVPRLGDNQWLYGAVAGVDNMPGTAYQGFLYSALSDVPIANTSGVWIIDYYAGMIYFGENHRPGKSGEAVSWCTLGTNNPRASFWHYTGKTFNEYIPEGGSGTSEETRNIIASEALTAGNFVNAWNDSGSLKVRKAIANVNDKEANGFVLSSYSVGQSAKVYLSGINTGLTGLTPGALYFLSATAAGGVSLTPPTPTGAGFIVQEIGKSFASTEIKFLPSETVELAYA